MNNELINVKEVDFEGAKLLAIKDEESGKIYVGISGILSDIGFTRKQIDHQLEKFKNDIVINQGTRKIGVPSNGGLQLANCIDLDFLPILLAKLKITPKMEQDKPNTMNKIIEYQLKAKDVLAKVFIHKQEISQRDLLILGIVNAEDVTSQAVAISNYGKFIENKVREEEVKPLQQEVDYKEGVIIDLTKEITIAEKRQRISQIIRHNAKGKFQERYALLYEEFNKKYHVDVQRRLKNGKENGRVKKSANAMEYICSERYMNMTSELYDLCVKIFEADFIDLLDEWRDAIK